MNNPTIQKAAPRPRLGFLGVGWIGRNRLVAIGMAREVLGSTSNWLTWRTRIAVHFSLNEATVTHLHRLPLRFPMEEREKQRFLHDVREANAVVTRGVAFDATVGAGQNLTVLIARVASIGFGSVLVLRGELTAGTLVAFLGYVGGLFGPVQGLSRFVVAGSQYLFRRVGS